MPLRDGSMGLNSVPSLELTYPQPKVYLKMIFPLPNVRSVSSLEGMNVHVKHHPLQKNVESGVESFTYHDWTLWKIRGIPSDPPQLKFESSASVSGQLMPTQSMRYRQKFHLRVKNNLWVVKKTQAPNMDVSKNRGMFTPKMDGENNGTPYEQMDDLGGNTPYFWKHPYLPQCL